MIEHVKIKRQKKHPNALFLTLMLIFPIAQFCVFYIGVNANSVLLAFKEYSLAGETQFVGFKNFGTVLNSFMHDADMIIRLKNSGVQYLMSFLIGMPLNLYVSYAIWKKVPFSGFFTVILFLPSMISSMVFVIIVRTLLNGGLHSIYPEITYLLDFNSTGFMTVMIFGLWLGFASGLILYLGAMSRIPRDLVEYGALEGIGVFREFIKLVFPMIFDTITTFVVVGIAGFFSGYGALYSFFGTNGKPYAEVQTLGYYFFVIIQDATTTVEYPFAAAAGLVFTLVAVPITLTVKWAMTKFGPSED